MKSQNDGYTTVDNGNDNAHDFVLRINNISETNPDEIPRIVEEAQSKGVALGDFLNSRTGLNRVARDEFVKRYGAEEATGPTTRPGTDFTRVGVVGDGIDHVNVQDKRFTTQPQSNTDMNIEERTGGNTDETEDDDSDHGDEKAGE
jgi:hypothetical protein